MEIKKIVTYPNDILTTPTKKTTLKKAQPIAVELFKTLNKEGGLGLSANQIGENKSVCVVNVTNPFFLLNPKIVKKEKEIVYKEGCLSIPDRFVRTNRYEKVWVEADNVDDRMYFGSSKEKKYNFKTNSYTANDLLVLEAVCVQHEIDHLNGLTIFDREYKPEQYRRTEKKYGRNEMITISKGKKTLTLKYKKGISYLEKGWKINE
jgi:peptide deformylase